MHSPMHMPSQVPLLYLKPVQTGFPDDSDARLVVWPLLMHPSVTCNMWSLVP